jgi:acyl transferase domain-containing protein
MRIWKSGAILALLVCANAWAANEEAVQDKPSFFASQSTMITARVEAINHETREVTLRGPEGNEISFTASEEARNLKQVSVGDIVNAEYVESISIEVMANKGAKAGVGEVAAMARTKEGEMPGVAAMDTQIVTATVEEINLEANTFKLKGPDGQVEEYVARNPENLKRAEVGDLVVFTMTEAVAISVEVGE